MNFVDQRHHQRVNAAAQNRADAAGPDGRLMLVGVRFPVADSIRWAPGAVDSYLRAGRDSIVVELEPIAGPIYAEADGARWLGRCQRCNGGSKSYAHRSSRHMLTWARLHRCPVVPAGTTRPVGAARATLRSPAGMGHRPKTGALLAVTHCGKTTRGMTVTPLSSFTPEQLCRTCWPDHPDDRSTHD